MSSIAVRIPRATHERLRQLAESKHKPKGEVVAELLDAYQREAFWQEYEQTSAAAQADPALRRKIQDEQREFDGTLMDGLEDAPWSDE
jgi:predicted DNA-binding protein